MSYHISRQFGDYLISSDKILLDLPFIHRFLNTSYWAKDIPVSLLETAVENSFCLGIYHFGNQVGFGRIVTDYATYGYLADVFIVEAHRGLGLSKLMMEEVMALEFVRHFRRFALGTKDAHGLYAQYGFTALRAPERMMEIHQPDIYQRLKQQHE